MVPNASLTHLQKMPSTQPFWDLGGIAGPASHVTELQLQNHFSGAPQFFALSEGHSVGAPHPTVTFPWDSDWSTTNLCDYLHIYDDAWNSMTAWPEVTWNVRERLESKNAHQKKREDIYIPLCRERPHMLSMQGLERGTIGYIAALELGVADILHEPFPPLGDSLSAHRKRLLSGEGGLRPFTESRLVERLMSASMTYRSDRKYHLQPAVQLYSDLFTHTLFPLTQTVDSDNPYGLQIQINILVEILAIPVWIDFSIVEWRIKLGEVLWGPPICSDSDDHIFINEGIAQQLGNQKYWLLLQILLSCELILRLDAISMNVGNDLTAEQLSDIKHIDESATTSVRWSLLLARLWLDNIQLEVASLDTTSTEKPSPGWLATLSSIENFEDGAVHDTCRYVQIQSRHQGRQLHGLLQFARELRWPNMDALETKIINNDITLSDSLHSQPMPGTSPSASIQRVNSYFITHIVGGRRSGSKRRHASAVFHPSGWLSNSYISGLVLPGEGLSHFLICALLDNDKTAVSRLGREANLYSGFSYKGRSFWSSACVVGRVLAGGKGASQCVGWISSDVVPKDVGDAWVDIDVVPLAEIGNLPHSLLKD